MQITERGDNLSFGGRGMSLLPYHNYNTPASHRLRAHNQGKQGGRNFVHKLKVSDNLRPI